MLPETTTVLLAYTEYHHELPHESELTACFVLFCCLLYSLQHRSTFLKTPGTQIGWAELQGLSKPRTDSGMSSNRLDLELLPTLPKVSNQERYNLDALFEPHELPH